MAYPTSVNDQITDSVTQTAPKKSAILFRAARGCEQKRPQGRTAFGIGLNPWKSFIGKALTT